MTRPLTREEGEKSSLIEKIAQRLEAVWGFQHPLWPEREARVKEMNLAELRELHQKLQQPLTPLEANFAVVTAFTDSERRRREDEYRKVAALRPPAKMEMAC